ncbi:MAG: thioredoxin 1 [Salibacteraceae bacterium]|jgi:thioredoxin-like negative regulator of GroEL
MTKTELHVLIQEKKGIVVYFKSDTCAPCKALRPKVETLVFENFPEMNFVIVDTMTDPILASAFNVFSNPTILVFFEGKEYLRKSKYIGVSELGGQIDRIYKMVF